MGIKQEIKMVKKNEGQEAANVDDLISGVESCKISNDSSKDNDITERLRNIKLEDKKVKKLWTSGERNSQAKEDDEREKVGPRSDQTQIPDNLVRLDAPSADDSEEDEDNVQLKHEEVESLGERGPMLGVPANYNTELGHNYIANKPCTPYHMRSNLLTGDSCHMTALPANFPDYTYQNMRAAPVKGSKREREDREIYHEPPKYVRPQIPDMTLINNLNAPWNGPNSGVASENGKTVSQVYQTQMSGGTVYTPKDMPYTEDQIFNVGFDSHDSLELRDLFGLGDPGLNIRVDADVFLATSGPPSPQGVGALDQGVVGPLNPMSNKMNVGLHNQQQWHNLHNPLPPVSHFTQSLSQNFQQQQFENFHQQTAQPYQESGHRGKRGSFGNDDYSDGYGSDLSPSHEIQSPPVPSPISVMDASPAGFIGSPPRTNWSPPPSNMSHSSVDSGVYSPMADDQNGYASMKSPRQGHAMSPQNVTSIPGTPRQARVMSMSPPHQNISPPLTISPSCQTVSQEKQVAPSNSEVYVSRYIDAHLADLDCALEVASQDLMAEKLRKGMTSFQNNISNSGNYRNNIMNNSNIGFYNGKVSGPPQNFPVAIVSSSGMRNTDVISNSQVIINPMSSQGIPNLPTTVPITLPLVNKDMGMCQSVTNGITQPNVRGTTICNRNTVQQVPHPSVPGAFIITSAVANITPQPAVSNQGKIAIAPMNPKPKPTQGQGQMLPVIVTTGGVMSTNGTVTPVIIMPSNVPPKTPPKILRTLAPKDPAKQTEKAAEINIKTAGLVNTPTNGSGAGHGEKPTNTSTPNSKKVVGSSVEKLLNLARRLVAEMSTNDLKYKDEDGDTYLHVAVCKADSFMVQALLERLVREKLTEMIDMQNSEGQTPLYLAVSTNHAEMVKLLVEQGADVNPFAESTTSTGHVEKTAAIHCASTKGEKYLETLKALLKARDINLDQVNSDGYTALNCAILAHGKRNTDMTPVNSIPIIRALIHAGADPNLKVQQSGKTALMYTLESRDLDLIESTFQMIEPSKLSTFLKTQAFDSSSCFKIAESLKATLDPAGQQRLINCLRPGNSRGIYGSSS